MDDEAVRRTHGRYGNVLKAEGLVAFLAVKMHVKVIVRATVAVAELVACAVAGVFKDVHQMGLPE